MATTKAEKEVERQKELVSIAEKSTKMLSITLRVYADGSLCRYV